MSTKTQLRPAVINAKMVFRIGTLLWALALAVLLVLSCTGTAVPSRYPLVCISGIVLGAAGYWWAHRNHLINDEGISKLPGAEG